MPLVKNDGIHHGYMVGIGSVSTGGKNKVFICWLSVSWNGLGYQAAQKTIFTCSLGSEIMQLFSIFKLLIFKNVRQ